ncbi:hypothetical protein [Roseivivax isoporae]|uniref:Uncharacterized protein n=1 Tax=Roseivivax isoporae LMG 25204 TaxID=1449351 RepID=X7F419_9RHOB|nr:hypothetical protein [Roseivivax isoporae]ETX26851.1 hypothetical protein RISW2_18825 [Roseivivax isoporae LMG 25204]
MALRLARKLAAERRLELGYGVAVTVAPFSFADFKQAEAAAMRVAEAHRPPQEAALVEAIDDEDLPPETMDSVRGLFAQHLVVILLARHGRGWEGVEAEDGTAAPFTTAAIGELLDLFPGIALTLARDLLAPFEALVSEGNASAPSQGTGTPAG